METLRDKLQKWKVAGAIFLFVAAITIPALGWSFIGDDCCVYAISDKIKMCPRLCLEWRYRNALCCSWGWTCPTAGGGTGYNETRPRNCVRVTRGGYRCPNLLRHTWRGTRWDTTC